MSESSFTALRARIGFTEAQASELLGVPAERIAAYESGEVRPTSREVQILRGFALLAGGVRENKAVHNLAHQSPLTSLFRTTLPEYASPKRIRTLNVRLPHPIPYQGSKRNLAPLIARYVPSEICTWYEPFAGSAAMTLWAASRGAAAHYVIADRLEPIAELWKAIIERPTKTADRYESIWSAQMKEDIGHFNRVRDRYNTERDPVDLLYLICRCVKNAVRFNGKGHFTQSVDKRRLGMRPEKMRSAIQRAAHLLKGKTEVRVGDWLETTRDARAADFVYMDPPYLGTSIGRDKRYAHQLGSEELITGLRNFHKRSLRFALSYDGMTGNKEYGPPLPEELGLTRLLLHAGRSSQATLSGLKADTIESLYMSPGLAEKCETVIRPQKGIQEGLPL